MKKNSFIWFIVLLLSFNTLWAEVIVDFRETHYDDVMEWIDEYDTTYIDAVLISHPFKRIGKTDFVYYFWDSGDYSYQGRSEPEYGTDDDVMNLYSKCYYKNIKVYCFIDIFSQTEGFNTGMWSYDNFLPESILYYPDFVLDIDHYVVDYYMEYIFSVLKEKYINAYVFDFSGIPYDKLEQYDAYIQEYYSSGLYYIYAETNADLNNLISPEYYWDLRTTGFVNPVSDLSILTNHEFPDYIPIVESDNFSINNIGTALFLLSGANNAVLPSSFFESDNFITLIQLLDVKEDLKWNVADEEVVFLYSDHKIIGFNMSDQLTAVTTSAMIDKNGFYKSEFGGAILRTTSSYNFAFMLPRSIYVWDIE